MHFTTNLRPLRLRVLTWPVRRLVLVLVVRPPDSHADGGLVAGLVLVDLRHLAHVHLGLDTRR